jgi:hypothetical protein
VWSEGMLMGKETFLNYMNGENTRKVQIYITKHPNEKKK